VNKWAKLGLALIGGLLLTFRLYTSPPAFMSWLFGTPLGLALAPGLLVAVAVPLHFFITRKQRAN
jgi:hypothetical protein